MTDTATTYPMRSIRRLLRMSQAALAQALDMSQSSIAGYEAGRFEISPAAAREVLLIAQARGVALTMGQIYGTEPIKEVEPEEAAALADDGGLS